MGPYKIVKRIGASAYQLSSQGHFTRHMTSNEQYLRSYRKGTYPLQVAKPAPPADLIDGEEEWEVELIKNLHYSRGQLQYLVHWKDFDISEGTWEPAWHLAHFPELVNDFHLWYPNKPRPQR